MSWLEVRLDPHPPPLTKNPVFFIKSNSILFWMWDPINGVDAKDFLLQFLFLILIISLGDEQTVRIKTLTYHHV